MKLKKGYKKNIPFIFLLFLTMVHISAVALYCLGNINDLGGLTVRIFFTPETYRFVLKDDNGKYLFTVLSGLSFFFSIYYSYSSLFERKFIDDSDFGLHGTATFQDAEELMDGGMLANNKGFKKEAVASNMPFIGYKKAYSAVEGIIIGQCGRKLMVMHRESTNDNKNVFVMGPSGSAKGQSYVITNLVNIKSESIVVTDVKEENWTLTHQIKVDQGYKVGRLDFVDFNKLHYNPFDYVHSDEDAQKLTDNISANATQDAKEDAFFAERARAVFRSLMIYTKTHYPKLESNMDSLITFYDTHIANEKAYMKWLDSLEDEEKQEKGIREVTAVFASLTGKTRSSVCSNFDSLINIFRLEKVREMTKFSDLDFEDFVTEKYCLYVKIAVPKNPFKALTGAFFTQMIDAFFTIARRSPISELPNPINIIMDEKKQIGKIDALPETLALVRSYLINITTIWQDMSQVETLYGREGMRELMGNHGTKIVLGVNEEGTAKYFSNYFGEQTVKYYETTGSKSAEQRLVTSKKQLVTVNDLMTMKKRNVSYVQMMGHNVSVVQKPFQHKIYGSMITKRRKYNYDKFREKFAHLKGTPLYKGPVFDLNIKSYAEVYEDLADGILSRANRVVPSVEGLAEAMVKGIDDKMMTKKNDTNEKKRKEAQKHFRISLLESIIKKKEAQDLSEAEENQLELMRREKEALEFSEHFDNEARIAAIKDKNMKHLSRLKRENRKTKNKEDEKNLQAKIMKELGIMQNMMEVVETQGEEILTNTFNEIFAEVAIGQAKGKYGPNVSETDSTDGDDDFGDDDDQETDDVDESDEDSDDDLNMDPFGEVEL